MAAAAVNHQMEMSAEELVARNLKYITGVQSLFRKGIQNIPDVYVQPPHQRVDITKIESSVDIPVIDLAGLQNDERRSLVLADIRNASEKWGFFQVINHGVPLHTMERMMHIGRKFHELPIEEKMIYHSLDKTTRSASAVAHYFQTIFNVEKQTVLEWRDALAQRCYPTPEEEEWLKTPSDYKDAVMEYSGEIRKLAKLLLSAMSEALNLSSDTLSKSLGDEFQQFLLINYYPPCPNPELVIGANSHSDNGGLTVLLQDETGGLQVSKEGNWYEVKPLPNAFVINVGDELEVVTNGIYKSVEHRAIRRSGDSARISIATFCNPSHDTRMVPIPELCTKTYPARYREHLYADNVIHFFNRYYDKKSGLEMFKL